MKPLILDQPAQQALPARLFWALLTAAGWGVWIALWLPVLRAIPGMLGVGHRDLDLTGAIHPRANDGPRVPHEHSHRAGQPLHYVGTGAMAAQSLGGSRQRRSQRQFQ